MTDIKNILDELEIISTRLDKIECDILYLKKGSDNMTNHITFIEAVYDTVKYPFYFIMNKFHNIKKIPEKEALLLEYKNKN